MNDPIRYSTTARTLHWLIAALVIANIVIGIAHDPLGEVFAGTMMVHKSIGLTILTLTLARLVWRLGHRPPPMPAAMPSWEQAAAKGMHAVFYVLLIVLPLSGWLMSSAGKRPLTWFDLFAVPKFAVTREDAIVQLARGHGAIALIFALLILLHIAAALRHHFILKDQVLRCMIG